MLGVAIRPVSDLAGDADDEVYGMADECRVEYWFELREETSSPVLTRPMQKSYRERRNTLCTYAVRLGERWFADHPQQKICG